MASDGGQFHVANVFKGVAYARVRSQTDVVVVNFTRTFIISMVDSVLDEGSKADCIENIWLSLATQPVSLSIAAALNVEDVVVGPDVLVITDQESLRV